MSIVQERSKRSTAGTRMSALVGEALENDETFWTSEVWNEDEGSDNDSFRESDEDSENRIDTFDSDFNDSESDEDDENDEISKEENELKRQDRMNKRKSKNKYDIAKAGRDLFQKRRGGTSSTVKAKGFRKKDLMGDGMNAGLVLNVPPPGFLQSVSPRPPLEEVQATTSTTMPPQQIEPTSGALQSQPAVPVSDTLITKQIEPKCSAAPPESRRAVVDNKLATTTPIEVAPTLARSGTSSHQKTKKSAATPLPARRQLRGDASTTSQKTRKKKSQQQQEHLPKKKSKITKKSSKKLQITQEELLLEAATVTEPKNLKWLLGRERTRDLEDVLHNSKSSKDRGLYGNDGKMKLIERFYSKRSCFNIITFPEMEAVPEILSSSSSTTAAGKFDLEKKQNKTANKNGKGAGKVCIITGKLGCKYRDPKTNMFYYDVNAFKELRRRYDAGEALDQRDDASQSIIKKEQYKIQSKPNIRIESGKRKKIGNDESNDRLPDKSISMNTAGASTTTTNDATDLVSVKKSTLSEKLPQDSKQKKKKPKLQVVITNASNCIADKNVRKEPATKAPVPIICSSGDSNLSGSMQKGGDSSMSSSTVKKEPVTTKNISPTRTKKPSQKKPVSLMKTQQQPQQRMTAPSPTTASMINNALAAYQHQHQQ